MSTSQPDLTRSTTLGSMHPGQWAAHRTLDPVRDAALKSAVAIACVELAGGQIATWETIIDRAAKFEQYLTGEEAND
jgi:hypothetical protein